MSTVRRLLEGLDAAAARLAADEGVSDQELQAAVRPLLYDQRLTRAVAGSWLPGSPWAGRVGVEDLAATLAGIVYERSSGFTVDRAEVAGGVPVTAKVMGYLRATAPEAARVAAGVGREVAVGDLVEREQEQVGHEVWASAELLGDLTARVREDIGQENRYRLVGRTFEALYALPDLVLPAHVDELVELRRRLLADTTLASRSLEHVRAVCDGVGQADPGMDQLAASLWDATTRAEREVAAAAPEGVLWLWALSRVLPYPVADTRERRALAAAVRRRVGRAQADLAAELAGAFLDAYTVPVASKDRSTPDQEARVAAARAQARRLPALAARAARLPGAPLGGHWRDVLDEVWACWVRVRPGRGRPTTTRV